jgi:hypothetical protein
MNDIYASIRLRPTRIGFLVKPTDMASIRKIMRACTCLWGGIYSPIIPVFQTSPKEWRPEKHDRIKGLAITKRYVEFFEPDVFVESESGLLKKAGLGALQNEHLFNRHVISLDQFLAPQDHRDWSEPAFGLSISDVFRDLYEKQHQFKLRKERSAVFIKPDRSNGLVEAIFGVYPHQKDTGYITRGYKDVFEPRESKASPEIWLQVFKKGTTTPLRVTNYKLDTPRNWDHDLIIYVFDPQKSTDLIDIWNLRLEPHPVLPVPVSWFSDLADTIRKWIIAEHRPVRGNPYGVMHNATVEISRSIGKTRGAELIKTLKEVPAGALRVSYGGTPIWIKHTHADHGMPRPRRLEVTHKEHRTTSTVKESKSPKGKELTVKFDSLDPAFAQRYGGIADRWVNVVRISSSGYSEKMATVFPFNIFDRRRPQLALLGGDQVVIGSEGWVFGNKYKNIDLTISLLPREAAVIGSLKERGIEAQLSEPGYIAQQMLDHLGGLWGVHLLKDLNTLQLLNKMAGGVRLRKNDTSTIEETFERRSAPVREWTDLISRRQQKHSLPDLQLSDFTERNIIRLGLETDCPHCHAKNWHSLTLTDYTLPCERCLNEYKFPQATLQEGNKNWHYRVVGPFSVPDFGRGAHSTLLTLRLIQGFSGSGFHQMTFSTAMNLKFDGIDSEVDFVVWRGEDRHEVHTPPDLIIGEAKSLGQGDLIKTKDLKKLKTVAKKLPGAIIVLSVLRDCFTKNEKLILKPFVKWGRRPDIWGEPTNPVLLLTTNELFMNHFVSATWKELGEPHKSFSDFMHTQTIRNFAEATQCIYLGLLPVSEDRAEAYKRNRAAKTQRSLAAIPAP